MVVRGYIAWPYGDSAEDKLCHQFRFQMECHSVLKSFLTTSGPLPVNAWFEMPYSSPQLSRKKLQNTSLWSFECWTARVGFEDRSVMITIR